MTKYKVTILFNDVVTAKNIEGAKNKACWMLPLNWSDYMTVEPCDKKTYEEYTREE